MLPARMKRDRGGLRTKKRDCIDRYQRKLMAAYGTKDYTFANHRVIAIACPCSLKNTPQLLIRFHLLLAA
jgi:hypothetical protein